MKLATVFTVSFFLSNAAFSTCAETEATKVDDVDVNLGSFGNIMNLNLTEIFGARNLQSAQQSSCLGANAGLLITADQLITLTNAVGPVLLAGGGQTELDAALADLAPKTYKICPGTTITTGNPTGGFETSGLPTMDPPNSLGIYLALPGVTIQCGENGNPADNCVMAHGTSGITTVSKVPNNAALSSLTLNTNGLVIKGMTFSGYDEGAKARRILRKKGGKPSKEGKKRAARCDLAKTTFGVEDSYPRVAIIMNAPSTSVTIDSCIFQELEGSVLSVGRSLSLGQGQSIPRAAAGTISVTMKNTKILDSLDFRSFINVDNQNMKFQDSMVSNVVACESNDGSCAGYNGFLKCTGSEHQCEIENVSFESSSFGSALVVTKEGSSSSGVEPVSISGITFDDVDYRVLNSNPEVCPNGVLEVSFCDDAMACNKIESKKKKGGGNKKKGGDKKKKGGDKKKKGGDKKKGGK